MYYKLEILYDDLTTLVRYFEEEEAAEDFVWQEGDDVVEYNIYEVY